MAEPLQAVLAVTLVAAAFWHWSAVYAKPANTVSGDGYYIRRFAFARKPVSAPYCWRPLYPWIARYTGFRPLSYACAIATPVLLYHYFGGGWAAAALAIGFVGNPNLFRFSFTAPDYCDALGHALLVGFLICLRHDPISACVLAALCGLCRENLGVTAAVLGLLVDPIIFVAGVGSVGLAFLLKREDKVNRHPLVEANPYDTLARWVRSKGEGLLHYAHTIQPIRGLPFFLPFGYAALDGFSRDALLGCLVLFGFAIPASGQSRLIAYSYALLAPAVVALRVEWAWFACLLQWFWPIEFQAFDEGGGATWGCIK